MSFNRVSDQSLVLNGFDVKLRSAIDVIIRPMALIEMRGERGKWFAALKDAGFLDVALLCARD